MGAIATLNEAPFRVYEVKFRSPPDFVGAADDASLGDLLLDLRKRGRIHDRTRIGILYRPVEGVPGEWLVNPWA